MNLQYIRIFISQQPEEFFEISRLINFIGAVNSLKKTVSVFIKIRAFS